jgi:hypothetical protein
LIASSIDWIRLTIKHRYTRSSWGLDSRQNVQIAGSRRAWTAAIKQTICQTVVLPALLPGHVIHSITGIRLTQFAIDSYRAELICCGNLSHSQPRSAAISAASIRFAAPILLIASDR